MFMNDGTLAHKGHELTTLIRAVGRAGIEVPEALTAEVERFGRRNEFLQIAQLALTTAIDGLEDVASDGYDEARAEVVKASLELTAIRSNDLEKVFTDAAVNRLIRCLGRKVSLWEAEVVERFNKVVDEYQLNDLAGQLPNLADPGSFKLMSLEKAQVDAIYQWRSACDHLKPLWDVYRRIAKSRNKELGPRSDDDDRDVNIFTACVLGNPGSNAAAGRAADYFAALASKSDATAEYRQISPFVVPVMSGYPLKLHSWYDAALMHGRLKTDYYEDLLGAPGDGTSWT